MKAITIEGLDKKFKNKELFKNFSLSIEENTIHGIVGPNGSGKTSLLRLLTGLYEPDHGRIYVKTDHAMLLENDYLYEDKSGLENIKLFGLYFGFKPSGYEDYGELLGIKKDLDRRVATYSKGMKRKLSLLIIVMMDREILYLDEVTSGVDPISRRQIRTLIARLKDEGKTVVITSHDLDEIEKVADVVTMIKDGQLLFTKNISDLKGQSLEDLFLKEGLK